MGTSLDFATGTSGQRKEQECTRANLIQSENGINGALEPLSCLVKVSDVSLTLS